MRFACVRRRHDPPGVHFESCGNASGNQRLHGGLGRRPMADTQSGSETGTEEVLDPNRGAAGWKPAGADRGPVCSAHGLPESRDTHRDRAEAAIAPVRAAAGQEQMDDQLQRGSAEISLRRKESRGGLGPCRAGQARRLMPRRPRWTASVPMHPAAGPGPTRIGASAAANCGKAACGPARRWRF